MSEANWPLPRASAEEIGLDPRRLEKTQQYVQTLIDQRTLAGAITLIARRGRIGHLACQGWLDVEARRPLPEDAIFRIYSMTKPIVCAAVLMLYEDCLLWPQDPVKRFLPEFADLQVNEAPPGEPPRLVPLKRDITIHDLLTHTGGLSYALAQEWGNTGQDCAAFIQAFAREPLLGQPGEVWRYSSSNDVLGRVIEVVSGQSLDVFLAERIFGPLGMRDTAFHVPPEKQDRFTVLYQHDASTRIERRTTEDRPYLQPPAFLSGGAGLVSTPADYLRFCLALLNGGQWNGRRILSRKTVELMRQDHLPPGHPPIAPFGFGYGYGVSVVRSLAEKQGIATVGEFGWGGAAGTNAWIDPAEDTITMVMYQLKPSKIPMIDHRIRVGLTAAVVD